MIFWMWSQQILLVCFSHCFTLLENLFCLKSFEYSSAPDEFLPMWSQHMILVLQYFSKVAFVFFSKWVLKSFKWYSALDEFFECDPSTRDLFYFRQCFKKYFVLQFILKVSSDFQHRMLWFYVIPTLQSSVTTFSGRLR